MSKAILQLKKNKKEYLRSIVICFMQKNLNRYFKGSATHLNWYFKESTIHLNWSFNYQFKRDMTVCWGSVKGTREYYTTIVEFEDKEEPSKTEEISSAIEEKLLTAQNEAPDSEKHISDYFFCDLYF